MILPITSNQLKVICTAAFMFLFSILYSQNVGINTDTPDESALLELKSSEAGFLPPRLTQVQRDAINNPATGLIIYNISEGCINYYDGALWLSLCGGASTSSSLIIETQPANVLECAGANVSFSVSATEGVTYQWQVNTGTNWQNISSAGTNPVYSNYTASTINLTGIVAGNNGWLYRCIVTGSVPPPVVSNAATLNVLPLPTLPSAITGDTEICGTTTPISTIQEFNSDVLTHGTNPGSNNIWFAPDYYTPIAFAATGGCTDGCVGYAGAWNEYWGNFLRLPEMDCSGNEEVSISFDVSHSYFSTHPNDWCKFNMWADGGYKHNVTSVVIDGADVTYANANGKGFQFTEERACAHVVVTFDISAIGNKSNILFYLNVDCAYNDSKKFYVWFDNISVNSGGGSSSFDYSVIDAGHTYTWQVPSDWTIDSGQGSNQITITPGTLDGDVIVTPSNACGNGPSQYLNVLVCP